MAFINGRLYFDRNRTTVVSSGMSVIGNVSIVIQNLANKKTIAVKTDGLGNYTVLNVENGDYQVVEYYDYPNAVASPGDYYEAVEAELLEGGKVPPIDYVNDPPLNATHLDCTSKSTIFVTVQSANVYNVNFLNGPVRYTPITQIMDHHVIVSDENLVRIADDGTFGSYPPGTDSQTFSQSTYLGVGEGFVYVDHVPTDGEYTIENITSPYASSTTWWSFADHTTGNEQGRMMVINGDNPNALLFNETVTLKPNTYYLFSAWILNMIKYLDYQDPAIGVKIITPDGQTLVEQTLGQLIPVNQNEPEWVEIGSIIYSDDYPTLIIQFISQGMAAIGNDYSLDDISLREVTLPNSIPLVKSVDKQMVTVNDTLTYTLNFRNILDYTIKDIHLKDVIPDGLEFISGTVKINNIAFPNLNPNTGFELSDLASNSEYTIEFSCRATTIPTPNPTVNKATIEYNYAYIVGGIPSHYNVDSNEVEVLISEMADISVVKTILNDTIKKGDIVYYNLYVYNHGPATSQNVVLKDQLPLNLIDAYYSLNNGISYMPYPQTNSINLGNLEYGRGINVLIKATVDSINGSITNTANVTSDTFDPDLNNNTSTITKPTLALSDLSVVKTVCPIVLCNCKEVLYQIIVINNGPDKATGVVVTDNLPHAIQNACYSVGNTYNFKKFEGSIEIGEMEPNTVKLIYLKGILHYTWSKSVTNIVSVSSTSFDPNLENNEFELTSLVNRCC